MYDKDWEVHLALSNPLDPIHGYIEDYLKKDDHKPLGPIGQRSADMGDRSPLDRRLATAERLDGQMQDEEKNHLDQ